MSKPSTVICSNDTATTEIYTLSLHDALPIYRPHLEPQGGGARPGDLQPHVEPGARGVGDGGRQGRPGAQPEDRKSTRLNSSHANISHAVFRLTKNNHTSTTSCPRTLALVFSC